MPLCRPPEKFSRDKLRAVGTPEKQVWLAAEIFEKRYRALRRLQQQVNAQFGPVDHLKQFRGGRGSSREIAQTNNQIEIARWMGRWNAARQLEPDTADRTPVERGRPE